MNSLFDSVHGLWIKAQLNAPPIVQDTLMPRLHAAKELIRLAGRPYLPVSELMGQGRGGPLTVTFIGLEFARARLDEQLFVDKPTERQCERIPFWKLAQSVESAPTDLVVVAGAKLLIRRLPRQSAIVLPEFVHHVVDVRGSWQDVRSRIHKNARASDLRRIGKLGYAFEVSHREEDFRELYDQMYLPTMQTRHGESSSPIPLYAALEYFRHGWLIWITRDGARIAGVVCDPQRDTFNARLGGVKDADVQLMREGAGAMIYYAALHWGNQQGYRAVNFLGTEPYLRLGVFQHKRKWGSTLVVPPYLHRQVWIRALRDTPAVCQFLKDTPCVTVDEQERLHGLVLVEQVEEVTEAMRAEWASQLMTPGLESLEVQSVREFVQAPWGSPRAALARQVRPKTAGWQESTGG